MSATAQAVSPVAGAKAKRPPAARNLRSLLPYVRRYKGSVLLGMLMNAGMGVAGTIAPLLIGAIIDLISGEKIPLAKLGRIGQISLGPLERYYQPGDMRALGIFCLALVIVIALKGIFSYWTRWILSACRATSNTICATTCSHRLCARSRNSTCATARAS